MERRYRVRRAAGSASRRRGARGRRDLGPSAPPRWQPPRDTADSGVRRRAPGNQSTDTMRLDGIHHITAITADGPRNVDFYARVLGLRLVKKTVNQDDPSAYHLFYADERGSHGADLTFFE